MCRAARLILLIATTLLAVGAWPRKAAAGEDQVICDAEWPGRKWVVAFEEREADDRHVRAMDPAVPLRPYQLSGARWLFGRRGMVYEVSGQFETKAEAETAIRGEIRNRYASSFRGHTFATHFGAYIPWDINTCKVDRMNPVIDPSKWIVEKNGLLVVGTQKGCEGKRGNRVKKVTFVGCDGLTNLFTDSVSTSCKAPVIDTCVYPMGERVFAIHHTYTVMSDESTGTSTQAFRVVDAARKKTIFTASESKGNDEFMPATITRFRDVDNDGRPEILKGACNQTGSCAIVQIMKWNGKAYVPRPLTEFPGAQLDE